MQANAVSLKGRGRVMLGASRSVKRTQNGVLMRGNDNFEVAGY
jgi:hypothetical protein